MAKVTKKTKKSTSKKHPEAQNPLILRYHRLMDAFSKSDDERDFYLDKVEGFMVFVDLDKSSEDLEDLYSEIENNNTRYCMTPKLTFYETKKIMEEFANEKVYDVDTKEKLITIINSKDARENFLETIYDNVTEVEKWHQYYQERFRIRTIEWLRQNDIQFVFEEDLDLAQETIDRLKQYLFEDKAPKDVLAARKVVKAKAKTYYSSEALNPRPKRGRPPKQANKVELDVRASSDIYNTVPSVVRSFLYTPDITNASSVTFSSKFKNEHDLLASMRHQQREDEEAKAGDIVSKLTSICGHLSMEMENIPNILDSFGDVGSEINIEKEPEIEEIKKAIAKKPRKKAVVKKKK